MMRTRAGIDAGSDVDTTDIVLWAEINRPPRMLVNGLSTRLCVGMIVSSAPWHVVAVCTALERRLVQYQVAACTQYNAVIVR